MQGMDPSKAERAFLVAGPAGFAVAKFGDGAVNFDLLQTQGSSKKVLKRPAASTDKAPLKKPAWYIKMYYKYTGAWAGPIWTKTDWPDEIQDPHQGPD